MSQLYTQKNGIASRNVAGSVILVDVDDPEDAIYTLNSTGQLLWQCLEQPQSAIQLAQHLQRLYPDLTVQRAHNDVDIFLNKMSKLGLLQ